jgi:hypothetical protein
MTYAIMLPVLSGWGRESEAAGAYGKCRQKQTVYRVSGVEQ